MPGDTTSLARDDREAVEVDRLIRGLRPGDRPSMPHPVLSVRSHARPRQDQSPRRALWVRVSVGLGVLLGAAVPQWPYARACGGWLFLYLFAVVMVVIAGVWGARLTWERRLGYAHAIALGTVLWGLALTSQEVLPRVGYAKVQATWGCVQ